jgi:DNA-binding beta-propeller fold protein YncE
MRRSMAAGLGALCVLVLAIAAPAVQAAPEDPLFIFNPSQPPPGPPLPYPPFEGPCGLAVDSTGNFYVADHYHDQVDVFKSSTEYITRLNKADPLDGPCGLALGSGGALYVNNFHRNVEKFTPSSFPPTAGSGFPVFAPGTTYASAGTVDSNHPTGVAVDPVGGSVYVNARTRIESYDSSGASLGQVGAASLEDGYGLAVSGFPATAGRLYVPDAADNTVKVYDPLVDLDDPVQAIDGHELPGGGFTSLRDSAIAVDSVSGEIYVADTRGFQFTDSPKAIIYVFDSTGSLEGRLKHDVIDASPVGLTVDNSATATQGRVYLTSGNSENAVIYAYPPGATTTVPPTPPSALAPAPGQGGQVAAGFSGVSGSPSPGAGPKAGASTITQKGTLRVTVSGRLAPKRLPRQGAAPISVSVGGEISTTDQSPPPRLKSMRIELNRNGRIDYAGLPTCLYSRIQPASSSHALNACRSSLVGEGSFEAEVALSGQEPYSADGKLLLFNGKEKGKPVLFGQIYAPRPFATSFVIIFSIEKTKHGTYGTALHASLPEDLGSWGNLTGIEMTLSRRYSYKGEPHSYLSSGCPAPKGFPGAVFSLARTEFGFAGGAKLSTVLSGECRVSGAGSDQGRTDGFE